MYEALSGMQRKIEALEDDLRMALKRLDHLEKFVREEDQKVNQLAKEVQHDHQILERRELIPVGL